MGKLNLNLGAIKAAASNEINKKESRVDNTPKPDNTILHEMSAGKLDPHRAKVEQYRYDVREQWHFTIPRIIKNEALEKAVELGIVNKKGQPNQKLFLYHCLRLAGVYIPDDDLLDARRVKKE